MAGLELCHKLFVHNLHLQYCNNICHQYAIGVSEYKLCIHDQRVVTPHAGLS